MGAYRNVLGEDYKLLSPALQKLHDEQFEARGFVEVEGKWIARILGFPRPGLYSVEMSVSQVGDIEVWDRTFRGYEYRWTKRTRQWRYGDRLLEKIGPLTFQFRLSASRGFLCFEPEGVRVWGIRLPRFLALQIWAVELDSGERFVPLVSFHLPLLGHICTYAGSIRYPWTSQSGSS